MICEDIQNKLILLFYEELSGTEKEQVESHLTACQACESSWEGLRGMLHQVKEAAFPPPKSHFLRDVVREVNHRIDSRNQGVNRIESGFLPRFRPVLASAGVLGLLILTLLFSDQKDPPPAWVGVPLQEEMDLVENLEFIENVELLEALDVLVEWEGSGPDGKAG